MNWDQGGEGERAREDRGAMMLVGSRVGGTRAGLHWLGRGLSTKGGKVYVHHFSLLPSELHPHLSSSSP